MGERFSIKTEAEKALAKLHTDLEAKLDRDVLSALGPIVAGADAKVRDAIEATDSRRPRLAVVLHTSGGIVEVAERMVNVFRHYYADVAFIIPDAALSAGTVLAMSGDEIFMDFFSCLGPIDPQVSREGKLVPALSYLVQFSRLIDKSKEGTLTTAELALLSKCDLAELHSFEEARNLSTSLLVKWLTNFKFKDWKVTESRKVTVTQTMKEERAKAIADMLSNHEHWHSHGRGITMNVLRNELNMRIQDFGEDAELSEAIRNYFGLLSEYMIVNNFAHLVHAKNYL